MIQYHAPRATLKFDQSTQVDMKNGSKKNYCQKLNTLKQDDKLINFDIANQAGTELLDQSCHEIDLDPLESISNFKKEIHSSEDASTPYAKVGVDATNKSNKDKAEESNDIEEIKSEDKILSTIENEYLSSNLKNDLNPDGTLLHHRWGKKQDLKMFKTLRQI